MNERRGKFHDVRAITERPAGAQNRTRFGHWEGDTVRGKTGGAAVVTLVDRKARYPLLGKVAKVTADNVRDCLLDLLSTVLRSGDVLSHSTVVKSSPIIKTWKKNWVFRSSSRIHTRHINAALMKIPAA